MALILLNKPPILVFIDKKLVEIELVKA
jgi:hypothetical protein